MYLRKRIYEILNADRRDDVFGRSIDIILIILITLNVIAVILESIPEIESVYGDSFYDFEVLSVSVFTIEYLFRFWTSVEQNTGSGLNEHPIRARVRYVFSPMALIDLLAILPFYLSLYLDMDLRALRALRLLRILKLSRYSASMTLLADVLREEFMPICAAFFISTVLALIAPTLAYSAEHEMQPDVFRTIPDAMWWAVVTMTTLGYGDMVPITVAGKFVGAVVSILGIGMVALPAGFLASGFSNAIHRRRVKYRGEIDSALRDGVITPQEEAHLEAVRKSLGLDPEDAEEILETGINHKGRVLYTCPHCKKPIFDHGIGHDAHDPKGDDNGAI